ncbi:hypothetical protein ABZ783_07135 [Micromonospora sp. NPDC047738]
MPTPPGRRGRSRPAPTTRRCRPTGRCQPAPPPAGG